MPAPRNTLFFGPSPSSSQTASRSVQPFCMGPKCNAVQCTMHCQWGRKPQNCPFHLGFRHTARRGPSHGHRQHAQKLVKIARVVPQISSRTETHTDVLITILRNRSRGRSSLTTVLGKTKLSVDNYRQASLSAADSDGPIGGGSIV